MQRNDENQQFNHRLRSRGDLFIFPHLGLHVFYCCLDVGLCYAHAPLLLPDYTIDSINQGAEEEKSLFR